MRWKNLVRYLLRKGKNLLEKKMNEGIYIAVSGALKQEKKMSVIANNLANVNSPGFKKDQIVFESLLPPFKDKNNLTFDKSRNTLLPPEHSNLNVAYVGVAGFDTDFSQGGLEQTNNVFDVALDGKGFFAVKTEDGTAYTRKGSFHLDTNNRLVDINGNPVQSQGGGDVVIQGVGGKITIDTGGTVSIGKGLGNIPLGQIGITDFVNGEKLVKVGEGLYQPANKEATGVTPAETSVRQGFVEQSNVKSVDEMTKMIETVRAFETYQKVIQTIDGVDERSVNSLGRIG
jgi:flagellar basal-body rod protein FlgF